MSDQGNIAILVLEDNLYALSALMEQLGNLEQDLIERGRDMTVVVYPTSQFIETEVNDKNSQDYDVIILDRDDKQGTSYHVLDIDKFGPQKVIAVSTLSQWNNLLKKRGVNRIVRKNFLDLENWAREVVRHASEIIEAPDIDIGSVK